MISRIYFYSTLTFYGTGNEGEADGWAGGRPGCARPVRPSAGGMAGKSALLPGRLPGSWPWWLGMRSAIGRSFAGW